MSALEAAASGITHACVITHADLDNTSASGTPTQTLALFDVAAGDVVRCVGSRVLTAFSDTADSGQNSLTLELGDGNDVNRFLVSQQLNENGTEVMAKAGGGATLAQNNSGAGISVISIPLILPSLATGDVLTEYTPGFPFEILGVDFRVTKAVSTASKAATLNLEIGTTNLTGGVVSLTSANCTPLGAAVAGTSVTAGNTGSSTDSISVEASSVTTFVEGEGVLLIKVRNLDTSEASSGAGYVYTSADTVDAKFTGTASKALSDLNAGAMVLFFNVTKLTALRDALQIQS